MALKSKIAIQPEPVKPSVESPAKPGNPLQEASLLISHWVDIWVKSGVGGVSTEEANTVIAASQTWLEQNKV